MENENLDLVEILKDCPRGTKLYSILSGEVELLRINEGVTFPIKTNKGEYCADGRYFNDKQGEYLLFPSKDQRDWSKFKSPIPDKALVWCWDDPTQCSRELRFYDAKNNRTFNKTGRRGGFCFGNYELYNGESPEWVKKTQELLED